VDGAYPAHTAMQLTLDDSFKKPIKSYVISKRFTVEFKTNTTYTIMSRVHGNSLHSLSMLK